MTDYLVKALAYHNQVRAYAVNSTQTIGEAQRRHHTSPTASAALGRVMTASVMLGAMLKDDEKLTVKMNGGGPIGTILGEIGEDFTSYLFNSEQTPSVVGVGVLVNPDHTIQSAGGFIIQLLPGTEEEVISKIEERLGVIPSISSMLAAGMTPEQLLDQVLGVDHAVVGTMPIQFKCQCSEESVNNAIISVGVEEIQDMIQTDGQAEANCHLCNETYHLTKEDLEQLLNAASNNYDQKRYK